MITVGIVTFHAGRNVIERLRCIQEAGYPLYIYDNSPHIPTVRETVQEWRGAKYLTAGRNVGLGVALCTLGSKAYYDGYKAMLFLDQDTGFNSETLNSVSSFLNKNLEALDRYCAVNFDPAHNADKQGNTGGIVDVPLIINSGTIFLLNNLKKMNWHDPTYFVDGVDYKFCLDALLSNFKIGIYSGISGFDHLSEQGNMKYRFFNCLFWARKYRASRIIDVIFSYSRVIGRSIGTGRIHFAVTILRLLTIYLLIQLYVHMGKPQDSHIQEEL